MQQNRVGQYIKSSGVGGEYYETYIPNALPPNPALRMDELYPLLDKASIALGRLDGMSLLLPNTPLFLYMYIRKEAVLSSQIEGTQSSLSDLLLYENSEVPGVPLDDVSEVSCYVSAMEYGLERLKSLPLSLRLIREIHGKLMNNARGCTKQPGEFRRSQNWLGGTRPGNAAFVPPPPEHLTQLLSDFEGFLHTEHQIPILIKAALAHVQFETIHPFLDGNGRLGRLLITLILCSEGALKQPLLYISLYLKAHRSRYYDLLQSVRETGNWEEWVAFFLEGVIETATQATSTASNILTLFEQDLQSIETSGRDSASIFKTYQCFKQTPIGNSSLIIKQTGLSLPTVLKALRVLDDLGIIREITGKERHKIFTYVGYLGLLNDGVNSSL